MGIIELLGDDALCIISHIITYGNKANDAVTEDIRDEIETMWNEPKGFLNLNGNVYSLSFKITAEYKPNLLPEEIFENDNPSNNYFRIEKKAIGNISFVDGLGSNTGYFQLDNLYKGSTTAAHEYGHTLGLPHPTNLDYRGMGVPGIMYPRGTFVDSVYQYDPTIPTGLPGGTMHPKFRKVRQADIDIIKIDKLFSPANIYIAGAFSSQWHDEYISL